MSAASAYESAPAPLTGRRPSSTYVVLTAAAGILFGLVGGVVWSRVAHPPAALVTRSGLILGETQLNEQVGVTMWFLATGFSLGVLAGYALCWKRSTYGVLAVAGALVATALACLVSYWSGVHLFGPSLPSHPVSSAAGKSLLVSLNVGTDVAYLAWPVGGLVGALAAIASWPAGGASASLASRKQQPPTHRAEEAQ